MSYVIYFIDEKMISAIRINDFWSLNELYGPSKNYMDHIIQFFNHIMNPFIHNHGFLTFIWII